MARACPHYGSSSRETLALRPLALLLTLTLAALLALPAGAAASQATISWDAAPEETVTGYRLYVGPAGQALPAPIDVGNATSHTLPGLEPGRAYRVAVAAYDLLDQEGALSDELVFTAPATDDTDGDGLADTLELAGCTSTTDADTDDDGLADGTEDADRDGPREAGETNPCTADTDLDGLQDGTELRVTLAAIGAGTEPATFRPDLDPATSTDPLARDTDADGLADGAEDTNRNGRVDAGESDPLRPDNPLLFADDFSDGGPAGDPSWRRISGAWTVTAGKSYASSPNLTSLALATAPAIRAFRSGRIETLVNLSRSGAGAPNAEIVFDYRDATHYRYVRLTPTGVSLGQIGRNAAEDPGTKAALPRRFALGRWHRVRIDIESGSLVRVYLNGGGLPALAHQFLAADAGRVGYRAVRARSLFDNIAVRTDAVLP